MKIHNMKQGSQEWIEIRKGKITGTDVGHFCIDPNPIFITVPQIKQALDELQVAYKKSATKDELINYLPNNGEDYRSLSPAARNLLIAKITESEIQDAWQIEQSKREASQFDRMIPIQRGINLEPYARKFYERMTGNKVAEVGFIESNCGTYGFSPDGIINQLEGHMVPLEIKCPMPQTHVRWLLEHYGKGTIPQEHFWQVQMAMVCSESCSAEFLSFCPGHAPLLVTVIRSEITDILEQGLKQLAVEKGKIDEWLDRWEVENCCYGDGLDLTCYINGQLITDEIGNLLDEDGFIIPRF